MYQGTFLLPGCAPLIHADSPDTQMPGISSGRREAANGFSMGTPAVMLPDITPRYSISTLPELQIVSLLFVGVDFIPGHSPWSTAFTGRPPSPASFRPGASFPDGGNLPVCRDLIPARSGNETFFSQEHAKLCRIHPVRPRRRRGIHEKRNADQCTATGRKPDCHC